MVVALSLRVVGRGHMHQSAIIHCMLTATTAPDGGAHAAPSAPADTADDAAPGEIVATGVREGSFPSGISQEATVGLFGQCRLLDTPIAAKSFNADFIRIQQALTSSELTVRDASFVLTGSTTLTGSGGGLIRGLRAVPYESRFDGFANIMNRRDPRLRQTASFDADLAFAPGLAVPGNVCRVGRQFFDIRNARSIPAFATVDAGLRYAFTAGTTPLTLRLNVFNLLDKHCFQSANCNTVPGAPRSARLSLAADL